MKTKSELTIILSEKFGNEILTRKDIKDYLESETLNWFWNNFSTSH